MTGSPPDCWRCKRWASAFSGTELVLNSIPETRPYVNELREQLERFDVKGLHPPETEMTSNEPMPTITLSAKSFVLVEKKLGVRVKYDDQGGIIVDVDEQRHFRVIVKVPQKSEIDTLIAIVTG